MNKKKIIFIILTIACIGFIWINSSMDGDESSALSSGVLGFVNNILMSIGIRENISEFLIRKMAHFTEFAILGALLTEDFRLCEVHKRAMGYVAFVGLLVALTDETIQKFSVGRYSSVVDVWIDFGGVLFGLAVCFWGTRFFRSKI